MTYTKSIMAKKKDKNRSPEAKRPAAPITTTTRVANTSSSSTPANARPMTFGKETMLWIAGGFGLVVLGMLLMMGGEMPSSDVWDESIIYSFRRITLAPIVILAGLGVVTYAILKK